MKQKHYNEWEFVYDPIADQMQGGGTMFGGAGANLKELATERRIGPVRQAASAERDSGHLLRERELPEPGGRTNPIADPTAIKKALPQQGPSCGI